MVIPLLLAACDAPADLTNTIRGIQIVAIEPIPAEPTPFERLTLKTWVADGIGRGVDVLVWVCTPIDGWCVEALPPNSTGLPLSAWTRVGRADVMFESTNPWPFFAGLAGESLQLPSAFFGGNLLVWALACAPGLCPIIDQVAIDPQSGSDAWYTAATALANPDAWIDELPRGQVSLAVKAVAVDLDDSSTVTTSGGTSTPYRQQVDEPGVSTVPNRAPIVRALQDEGRWTSLDVVDPDADPLLIRSFATAGGVDQRWTGDSAVSVMWEEPLLLNREPVRFVVAEDGRGGTGVWCSDPATDPCHTTELTLGTEDDPLEPGDGLALYAINQRFEFEVPFTLQSSEWSNAVQADLTVDGQSVGGAAATFTSLAGDGICSVQEHVLKLILERSFAPTERCAVLGTIATLRVDLLDDEGGGVSTSVEIDVVPTGNADLGCQGL